MEPIDIQLEGIITAINNLKLSSSCGVDGINSKVLKNTVTVTSKILLHIFRQSLETGMIPSDWKLAKIIPIFKSGNKTSCENYRPISLTCICCKILEHIIASHIYRHLESNHFFFKNQHGFRKGFSCETQLFEFTTELHANMDNNYQTDCVFLDYSKAFDRVAHCRLISKLSALKLDSRTLSWLRNFLSNRQQYTTVNNLSSSLSDVSSGVPQGSVLAPLLFLIFINDLPQHVSSCIRVFADDCIIYRPIKNSEDHLSLQNDLDVINGWCSAWLMTLNVSKCKVMSFTRKPSISEFSYSINHSILSTATQYRYLGVILTPNLSWSDHITAISASASKSLGFLRRNLKAAPSGIRKLSYLTLVRPQLEYACSIWSPHQKYLIDSLERIQNRASRFIANNYSPHSSISQIKQELSLPLLNIRRDIALLSFFHKITHSSRITVTGLQKPYLTSRRLHNHLSYSRVYGSTNAFNQSALPRAIRLWNSLPDDIASQTNFDTFRHILSSHFTSLSK